MKMLTVMVFAFCMSACVLDSAADQPQEEPQSEASTSTSTDSLTSNCSVVQFCNVPDSSEGTRCVQQSCGFGVQTAEKECKSETTNVCGSPVLPWIFVTLNGVHHNSTASCILSNRCGGQAPAGCFCDQACLSIGDCCFDGPC